MTSHVTAHSMASTPPSAHLRQARMPAQRPPVAGAETRKFASNAPLAGAKAFAASPLGALPRMAAPTSVRRTAQTYGYLCGGVGIAIAAGFGAARAGLFTLASAHPLAFFLTSFATSQTALAATKAFDPSHSTYRHAAFVTLSAVLGAGSAAIGPVGLGTLVGAAVLCTAAFVALSAASALVPRDSLKRTDGAVGYATQAWFALTLASLAIPPLGALRGVQVLLAAGGTGLFATQLVRNTQQMKRDATKQAPFDAMQAAIALAFPTFCLFTFSPSLVSAATGQR